MKRKFYGFTLIELVVVIAIIGVIVAIATPQVLRTIQNAQKRADSQTARHIAYAFLMWQEETGKNLSEIIPDSNIHKISSNLVGNPPELDLTRYIQGSLPRPRLNKNYYFYYKYESSVLKIYAGDDSNQWELFPEFDENYK
ncbi:prepilin-type N-terminal cleavage/methylation domain-containing protein [Caldicellulosiruptor acetigenus]|uniref:prepilin-type N-terminal cleavage/methylation domain-containing protein n=1 Tax=Caldicellulosiruptor acetigenus TaxID=301953 RepID=UPI0004036AD8|nr:prepilin-type N-terminal cleavage/methylation domain-containing protein [Caldicellulosiruptor acetigenus]WAM37051.1 prepilin-type N-terminal cleavage/methylation domain-containing protein [Caldicellulosiruptor acetigenus]